MTGQAPAPWRPPRPLPDPVARTARLVLRFPRPEDAGAYHEAFEASRDALLPWLPWAREAGGSPTYWRDRIEDWCVRRRGPQADDFLIGIFDPGGALAGGTGFHRLEPRTATAEVGYWIHPAYRGRGRCREAVAALLTTGFADWGFRRLKVCCAAPNRASVRVAEALGLRLEGRERAERFVEGQGYVDTLTFALLAGEWDPKRARGPGGEGAPSRAEAPA